jgi:hypothetical protein
MKRPIIAVLAAALALTGCASTDHYNAQREQVAAWERVETARASANSRKWDALAHAAKDADPQTRIAIVMALGMNGSGQGTQTAPMPAITDPNEAALRWASIILPSATAITAGYFGYRLGVTQSDNAAATSIAGYGSMTALGVGGQAATRDTAIAGFATFGAMPPSSVTTSTVNVGAGSVAGWNGGTAAVDQSRRCTNSQPWITTTTGLAGAGGAPLFNAGAFTC